MSYKFRTVRADQVRVGDILTYGGFHGLTVTKVARKNGQIVLHLSDGGPAVPTDPDNMVSVAR